MSRNPRLVLLIANDCELESVDLRGNPLLEDLIVDGNRFDDLDRSRWRRCRRSPMAASW